MKLEILSAFSSGLVINVFLFTWILAKPLAFPNGKDFHSLITCQLNGSSAGHHCSALRELKDLFKSWISADTLFISPGN